MGRSESLVLLDVPVQCTEFGHLGTLNEIKHLALPPGRSMWRCNIDCKKRSLAGSWG